MTGAPITHEHAIRIAKRLARNATKTDGLLSPGIVRRLWALLDSHPLGRKVYDRPPHLTLAEHAESLTVAELEDAASRLASLYEPSEKA